MRDADGAPLRFPGTAGDIVYTPGLTDAPVHVDELATSDHELPTTISDDGCRLYFARRNGGTTKMYVATRTPP